VIATAAATDPTSTADLVALGVSVVAALISIVALWRTHLSWFRPVVTAGGLMLRIYPIRNDEGERWFIASASTRIQIANSGARAGRVLGLRLVVEYPALPIPGAQEVFGAQWELDPAGEPTRERFKWLADLMIGRWTPFVVLPHAAVVQHVAFEERWDTPVVQPRIVFHLELYTDRHRRWERVATWDHSLTPASWSELADMGTSITVPPDSAPTGLFATQPPDLHRYTGTIETLPTEGFAAGSSYLDYPEQSVSGDEDGAETVDD
jgi:hypothetical protein